MRPLTLASQAALRTGLDDADDRKRREISRATPGSAVDEAVLQATTSALMPRSTRPSAARTE